MERRLEDNKGFTLVEILAAMVLLSIVAVPLAKTFMDGFKFQARGQVKTEANKVIEYVTEQLKNENYSKIVGDSEEDIKKFEKDIKDFAKGESSELDISIDSLSGINISSDYNVKIAGISAKEVQRGGVGTPDVYDLEMEIFNNGTNFLLNSLKLKHDYYSNVLKIESFDDEYVGDFNILINNKSNASMIIEINKRIENNVKFYTKGDITLTYYIDPSLSRAEKTFKEIKLGEKSALEDEKEYLCEASITAVNKNDNTITSSMNVTFSVFIENK